MEYSYKGLSIYAVADDLLAIYSPAVGFYNSWDSPEKFQNVFSLLLSLQNNFFMS